MEYVETEMFSVEGSEIRAMSSSELLACNPRGPSMGCVGALHTYAWSQPAIREVQGLMGPYYFASTEN